MVETIGNLVGQFWVTLTAMSPYLLFGFFIAGLLSVVISPQFVESHLGSRGLWPIVKASLFGVPLPLCSCGVIPVSMSLRKHGASKAASISFLLSTPQTGVDSFFVTYSLLGPIFAIFRPIIAFVTGVIGGIGVQICDDRQAEDEAGSDADDDSKCDDECCSGEKKAFWLWRLLRHGFITLPRDIGKPMLVGLFVAAAISAMVPDDFFAEKLGSGIGAMLLMMLLGIPVYVCATASIPVAAAMIAKGLSPGAALVFLMTGPATNAAALATIWKVMGSRTAIVYLLTVAFCALGSGILLDWMFPDLMVEGQHLHEMLPTIWEHVCAVLLLLVLLWGIAFKKK